jgi:hypothetical protein
MWCNLRYTYFLCTWVLKLASRLCTPVCFWTYSHVLNSLCHSSQRRQRKKNPWSRKKNFVFSFACHRHKTRGHGSLCSFIAPLLAESTFCFITVAIWLHLVPFHYVCRCFVRRPSMSIWPFLSTNIRSSGSICHRSFLSTHCIIQIVCTMYIRIQYRILQTICCVRTL